MTNTGCMLEWLRETLDAAERAARHDAELCGCHDPAAVLRRIAKDRELLDDILAEPHAVLTPGGSTEIYCDADNNPDEPCNCGRDARVKRHVRLLAESWGWVEETP